MAKQQLHETAEEAARLTELFKDVNRAQFARDFKVPGGQAAIYQHMTGHRPISLEAAIAYADGFKCSLRKISPRWADLVEKASRHLRAEDTINSTSETHIDSWPFLRITAGRLQKLSEDSRAEVEADLLHSVERVEARSAKKSATKKKEAA